MFRNAHLVAAKVWPEQARSAEKHANLSLVDVASLWILQERRLLRPEHVSNYDVKSKCPNTQSWRSFTLVFGV